METIQIGLAVAALIVVVWGPVALLAVWAWKGRGEGKQKKAVHAEQTRQAVAYVAGDWQWPPPAGQPVLVPAVQHLHGLPNASQGDITAVFCRSGEIFFVKLRGMTLAPNGESELRFIEEALFRTSVAAVRRIAIETVEKVDPARMLAVGILALAWKKGAETLVIQLDLDGLETSAVFGGPAVGTVQRHLLRQAADPSTRLTAQRAGQANRGSL